jgi:glycerophosphoryl diester phosphodiesterase
VVTAHSGCDGTAQDSIESINAGIRNGADAVEVDVRLNGKGVLILSHDKDESRAYPGAVALTEAFEIIVANKRIGINCDVKERETVPAILALAAEEGIGSKQLILTGSSTPSMLAADSGIVKKAAVWLNIEEIVEDYYRIGAAVIKPYIHLIDAKSHWYELGALIEPIITDCLRLGVGAVNVPYTEQTKPLIARFIAGGLPVSVWTLNDRKSIEQAFEMGVINVTTRDTKLAVEVREKVVTLRFNKA